MRGSSRGTRDDDAISGRGSPAAPLFVERFTDPDAVARKLVEIANATEAVQDGRVYIERINGAFLEEGGTPDQFRSALARAITSGWLWRHESGTYVKFTPAGAELFA
jgi:hypothetical protein